MGERGEPAERVGVHHRRADPGDHVGAEGLLGVEQGRDGDRGAGREVEQGRDDGRRAEVEGDAEEARGGVAGLDVDEHVVDDHGGDGVVGGRPRSDAARIARDRSRTAGRSTRSSRSGSASRRRSTSVRWSDSVGSGSVTQRFCSGGAQDHLAADADRGRLRPGDQRRHLDPQVLLGPGPAGQPPAGAQLVRAERARVEPRHRDVALDDPHPALLHVPWPPQVESTAMPFQLAASNSVAPAGTRTSRGRAPSGSKRMLHPVRRRADRSEGGSGRAVTVRPSSPPRPSRQRRRPGTARSTPRPSRRCRAAGPRP